jgi:hypothetical protein
MALIPDDMETRYFASRAYVADKQFTKVIPVVEAAENGSFPESLDAIYLSNYLFTIKGDAASAQQAELMLNSALRQFGPEAINVNSKRLAAERQYVAGNVSGYLNEQSSLTDKSDQFASHIAAGNASAADADLKDDSNINARDHLILYIAATNYGQLGLAARHLDAAVRLLSVGDFEDRAYADALTGKRSMPAADLVRLRYDVGEKVVVLTAIGVHDPASREICFEMVRKIDFDKRFPHLLIEHVLASTK